MVAFNEETLKEVEALFQRYPRKVNALLPVLHLVQRENDGWIPPGWDAYVADLCETTLNQVRGVITFYNMYHQQPVGKFHLMICTCLPCGLCEGKELLEHVADKVGVHPGQTSSDGVFSLEEVQCLAACDQAPLIKINEDLHGPVSFEQVDQMLDELHVKQRSKAG